MEGIDLRACGRFVARGHNSPPDCCSVPLVLQVLILLDTIKNKTDTLRYPFHFLWQGHKDLVSPAGSVGASASQRSPTETRTPRHAVLESSHLVEKSQAE